MNLSPTVETWMTEARQLAAQCWCDDETKHIEMDTALAEAVARRMAAWMKLVQAALHKKFGGDSAWKLRGESIQTAAVALAIIECIDRNKLA